MGKNDIIRDKCAISKYANIWIALSFVTVLFVQCCLFHRFTSGMSILTCLMHPMRIISVYLQKVGIAIFIASFVFLFRRKYWIIYAAVINAIWILSECIYMQSFDNLLIDAYSASMVTNLKGFTSSILMYMDWHYLWLMVPIILLAIILFEFDNRKKGSYKMFCLSIVISLFLNLCHAVYVTRVYKKQWLAPITIRDVWNPITSTFIETSSLLYTHYYSDIHAFIRVGYEMIFNAESHVDLDSLSEEMKPYMQSMDNKPIPQSKLVIFLVESLENWAILPEITPNICNYIKNHNTLYAPYIKRQAKKGGSMDGQMLVNCGVLPLNNGAACFRFPHNRYPAISELYQNAAVLVPGGPSVWNQGLISIACGIDTNYTVSYNDAEIILKYEQVADKHDFIMILTSSSHSPFKEYADSSQLELPKEMPKMMKNYLKCINFMDNSIGRALYFIEHDPKLRDATIVITGDHTIFAEEHREMFEQYCIQSKMVQYKVKEAYCPLIMGGGRIDRSSRILSEAYQMDIYPTIIHAIGCDSFFWKGWGANLLDSAAQCNRVINEQDAFDMADKVIRSNWFYKYEQ